LQRKWVEINLDGLIGPTHHFGGLGVENKASEQSQFQSSNPRGAALEGLNKMELVAGLGVPQFYLPPPSRPAWDWLATLGFRGTPRDILKRCYEEAPRLLSAAFSSSFMWTANAATFAASCDSDSGDAVFKVANLSANLHRSIEATEREAQLRLMFRNVPRVRIEEPLFGSSPLRDEGAANVMRLCARDGSQGVYVFVYGEDESAKQSIVRRRKPRQTRLACELVARSLGLQTSDIVMACQTVEAIDAGVFHNDVIATSHESLLLYHESAFQESERVIQAIQERYAQRTGQELKPREIRNPTRERGELISFCVRNSELTLTEAVDSYLFNSQIVTDREGQWRMIAPDQCRRSSSVQNVLRRLQATVPQLAGIEYVSLDQSMANGGGPACLRLRASLTADQLHSMETAMRIDAESIDRLAGLIKSRYPEKLNLGDLAEYDFARECEEIARQIGHLWGANPPVSG
jgi:succinylarginine dihydrolase